MRITAHRYEIRKKYNLKTFGTGISLKKQNVYAIILLDRSVHLAKRKVDEQNANAYTVGQI